MARPLTFLLSRLKSSIIIQPRLQSLCLSTFAKISTTLDSETISQIHEKEKEITGSDHPVEGGPTASAQSHFHEPLLENINNIAQGEKNLTGKSTPLPGGPTAAAQSMATSSSSSSSSAAAAATATLPPANDTNPSTNASKLNSSTISKINASETQLSGKSQPVQGGPTAAAQKHVGETINSQILRDITEGENMVTGGERVKGGPTSTAQGELSKSR